MLALAFLLQIASSEPVQANPEAAIAFRPGSSRMTAAGLKDLDGFIAEVRTRFGALALAQSCNQVWPRDPSPLGRRRDNKVGRRMRHAGIRYVLTSQVCPWSHSFVGEPSTVQLTGLPLYSAASGPASEFIYFRKGSTRFDRTALTQLARFIGVVRAFPPETFGIQLCVLEDDISPRARRQSDQRVATLEHRLRRAGVPNRFVRDPACGGVGETPQIIIQAEPF